MLKIEQGEDAAPNLNGVVRFENILAAVIEAAVAKEKSVASEGEIFLVVAGNAVGNEGDARAIQFSLPAAGVERQAKRVGLIDFCVCVGFVAAFIPAPTAVGEEPSVDGLLEIPPKPYLMVVRRGWAVISGSGVLLYQVAALGVEQGPQKDPAGTSEVPRGYRTSVICPKKPSATRSPLRACASSWATTGP